MLRFDGGGGKILELLVGHLMAWLHSPDSLVGAIVSADKDLAAIKAGIVNINEIISLREAAFR